jgi:ATP citrate (pro-S)-lyase
MAQKAIREAQGKLMMARMLREYTGGKYVVEERVISVGPDTDLRKLPVHYKWLTRTRLVVKPDQLIKRRGKNKLILAGATYAQVVRWIEEKRKGPTTIYGKFDAKGKPIDRGTEGQLTDFIIEPLAPHKDSDECYVAITSNRDGDRILFHHQGGINVGDVDAKALKMQVPVGTFPTAVEIEKALMRKVPASRRKLLAGFIEGLFKFYADLNFAYLEINPIAVIGNKVVPLDLAAKLDDTAEFESGRKWGAIEFPPPFGRTLTKEEAYIEELDGMTGASLKLTVLNPRGRVWTMVAGGGASVIYADTITDLGYMSEMANYGEYSGDPNEEFTYKYAKTILDLMTRERDPKGKVLIIGGGIANFTDVANTFKGIVRALREYQDKLRRNNIKIFVRRGGPNYKEGLRIMRELGSEIKVPIDVYGPETHMTKVVPMAISALRKGGK